MVKSYDCPMERLKEKSYVNKTTYLVNGCSDFERFKNRAMYCENYYETYSEEKLPNTVKRKFSKKKDHLE